MGIFGALTTSVAGLRSQSYALENISGNIANSQTTAFKRIDTSFLDLIPDTGNTTQLAGSVDLTDILDQRDRDYCIAWLRSRWVRGIDVCGAGGR